MANPDDHVDLSHVEARGGETTGVTRYVLGVSLVLVIIVFIGIYLWH